MERKYKNLSESCVALLTEWRCSDINDFEDYLAKMNKKLHRLMGKDYNITLDTYKLPRMYFRGKTRLIENLCIKVEQGGERPSYYRTERVCALTDARNMFASMVIDGKVSCNQGTLIENC